MRAFSGSVDTSRTKICRSSLTMVAEHPYRLRTSCWPWLAAAGPWPPVSGRTRVFLRAVNDQLDYLPYCVGCMIYRLRQ
jgi:hypothetical protein